MTTTKQDTARSTRRIVLPVLIGVVSVAGIVYLREVTQRRSIPTVRVEVPVHDFGSVRQNEELHHVFRFVNESATPAVITTMNSTCSCTVPSKSILGVTVPGAASLDIPTSMRTGSADGNLAAQVTLIFEHGSRRNLADMHLRAKVIPDFRIEPNRLDFPDVVNRTPVTRTVRFNPDGDPEIRLMAAEP